MSWSIYGSLLLAKHFIQLTRLLCSQPLGKYLLFVIIGKVAGSFLMGFSGLLECSGMWVLFSAIRHPGV